MSARLWCLHVDGPDDVYAAPSKAHAERAAERFNARFGAVSQETGVLCKAVAVPWPHSDEAHAADVEKFCGQWMTGQVAQLDELTYTDIYRAMRSYGFDGRDHVQQEGMRRALVSFILKRDVLAMHPYTAADGHRVMS